MRATSSSVAIALTVSLLSVVLRMADAAPSASAQSAVLAKVVPGISKAQVKSLLGEPWRTVQYNDLDEVENEIWEYRGKDEGGRYRIHIEFDQQGSVVVVAKIPEAGGTNGTPAKN